MATLSPVVRLRWDWGALLTCRHTQKRPLMRRLQGGGNKRQVNPLCQTAGGACAAGRWPDECRHGKTWRKATEMTPRQQHHRVGVYSTRLLRLCSVCLEYLVQNWHFVLSYLKLHLYLVKAKTIKPINYCDFSIYAFGCYYQCWRVIYY